jgi:acetyl esterase/lipase
MAERSDEKVQIADGRSLGLDIFHPDSGGNGIAVVLLHGGAWRAGHRDMMQPYAAALAAHGFVAVCAEYRLVGEAPWPAQVEDVLATVSWLADHAGRLGIDGNRIVVEGFSAGGHLALLAAARAPRIGAVVAFFAPPSMTHESPRPMPEPKEMLLGSGADADAVAAASPIRQISARFPPTFLLAGVEDPLVTPSDTIGLFQALRAHGVATELHLYSGHTHEFSALPSMVAPVQAEVALFLQRNVVDPETYVSENRELNMFAAPGGPPMKPPSP